LATRCRRCRAGGRLIGPPERASCCRFLLTFSSNFLG
jgi:hypothetical protein